LGRRALRRRIQESMIWNRSSDFVVSRFGRILPSDAQTESWIFFKRIPKRNRKVTTVPAIEHFKTAPAVKIDPQSSRYEFFTVDVLRRKLWTMT
jgi:hypothetical protein